MAIYKQCSYSGCSKIVSDGVKYCEYHTKKVAEQERQRYKEYRDRRYTDDKEVTIQKFYNSKEWTRCKEIAKRNVFHIDVLEYYMTGRIVAGEVVHHVYEVRTDKGWNNRFDVNAMIYLTYENHQKVHAMYNKGWSYKTDMQSTLMALLKRFKREFGLG